MKHSVIIFVAFFVIKHPFFVIPLFLQQLILYIRSDENVFLVKKAKAFFEAKTQNHFHSKLNFLQMENIRKHD